MTDLPSRDALIEAGARALCDAHGDFGDDTKITATYGRTTYHALRLGDLRRARAVHAQINTLIGESKGTDTDTGTNR